MKKIPVALLGATGSVGQRFVELLQTHPWFKLEVVAASKQSSGKKYRDAVNWLMQTPLPKSIGELEVKECTPECLSNFPCKLVFSALDSSVAGEIEKQFAEAGYWVISNASHHRMGKDIPLLIPEINSDHLKLLDQQTFGAGKMITNPNCSSIGLSLALSPLHQNFGLEAVHVVTLQAISGAGYPGVSSMDILDNVIPYIQSEEEKIESEPLKILGLFCQDSKTIQELQIPISAHCNRVAVSDGHMASVSVQLKNNPSLDEVIVAWQNFKGVPQELSLPSAPNLVIHYFNESHFPQPKLHRHLEGGMSVAVGHLRKCPLLGFKFSVLSHNTIRGAAGGAILCAELVVKKNLQLFSLPSL